MNGDYSPIKFLLTDRDTKSQRIRTVLVWVYVIGKSEIFQFWLASACLYQFEGSRIGKVGTGPRYQNSSLGLVPVSIIDVWDQSQEYILYIWDQIMTVIIWSHYLVWWSLHEKVKFFVNLKLQHREIWRDRLKQSIWCCDWEFFYLSWVLVKTFNTKNNGNYCKSSLYMAIK